METSEFKPYLIVIGLIAATLLTLLLMGDVTLIDEADIAWSLPDAIAGYTGEEIRFCQNIQCMEQSAVGELVEGETCPFCGGKVDIWSLGEKRMLPSDTLLLRKRYRHPDERTIMVSIVLSGRERTSIHRPQMCIKGQGHQIVHQQMGKVPIPGRDSLKVMILDVQRSDPLSSTPMARQYSAFAYWFVGKGHETPSHLHRMFWMAYDNIFRGVSQRWAYIAVTTDRREGSDEHIKRITDFIAELYPLIRK